MTALNIAYATNSETPLTTLEFSHSALTDGVMRFVQGYYDLDATTEGGDLVTFSKSGLGIQLPERSTDGMQELVIQIDNLSNEVYSQLRVVQNSMRSNDERAIIKYRPYLESDLSSPAGAVLSLVMTGSTVNRQQATIRATWSAFPDSRYPRFRYYSTIYSGVKYA